MAEKQKILLPGENITTEEEYAPGRNSFAEKGFVKSKIMGIANFDDSKKEVTVSGRSVKKIKAGDIVTGRVMLVKESTVVLDLLSAENDKKIMGVKMAQLPVRNVSTEFVSDLKKTMKIGDLVRARVTMSSPLAIDVATNEKGLGVIKAYCSKCRQEMQYSGDKLMCISCGNVEERKWFEAEQKPREFTPREDRGRGGFGGGRNFGSGRNFRDKRRGFGGEGSFGRREEGRTNRGREFRKQGQGFEGHQNRPAQRW
jgi:exosome complex component CSL4